MPLSGMQELIMAGQWQTNKKNTKLSKLLGLLDDKRSTIRTWRLVSVNNMDENLSIQSYSRLLFRVFNLSELKTQMAMWSKTSITWLTMGKIWQMSVITVNFAAIKLVFLSTSHKTSIYWTALWNQQTFWAKFTLSWIEPFLLLMKCLFSIQWSFNWWINWNQILFVVVSQQQIIGQ